MAPSASSSAKKHALTLAQLSSYDDILTDALVDRAWYWTTIPKNRTSYHPSRGVKEEEITTIIQNHLIRKPDIDVAEEKLLATDGLKRFHNGLKTTKEKADFKQHLRRYTQIYLPDCPFEVSSTNRYTVTTHEASIVARRYIKRNETITYLSGIQVVITPEEEEALSSRKKDFSIVVSSRNRMTSLFMGPARFANHDCGANAKLVITGQAGIDIVAVRSINVGEEITVTYGENYFGENNCECLCRTCEDNLVNGWKQPDWVVPVKKSIEDDLLASQGYNTRGRRRYDRGESSSRTPSITPDIRPKVLKSKVQRLRGGDRASTTESGFNEGQASASKRKRDRESLATPPITPSKKQKTTHYEIQAVPALTTERGHSSDAESAGALSTSVSSNGEAMLTDVTTPEDTTDPADVQPNHTPVSQGPENVKQEHDAEQISSDGLQNVAPFPGSTNAPPAPAPITPVRPRGLAINDILNTPSEAATPDARTPTDRFASAFEIQVARQSLEADEVDVEDQQPAASEPSEMNLVVATEPDESSVVVETSADPDAPLKRGRGRPRKHPKPELASERRTSIPTPKPAHRPVITRVEPDRQPSPALSAAPVTYREPGDYELTPRLLSEPDMAWVRCMVCTNAFVQQNAYYTRSSCPRCERHSKLYGYVWPKTQREGPWDKEERVLDHRTVHRFLALNQEMLARGRTVRTQSQTGTPKREGSAAGALKRGFANKARLFKGSSKTADGDHDGINETPDRDTAESEVRRSGRMRKASFKVVGSG
ncbi:Histone-lysine N-methyltransferase set9 [Cytospora mali]|uniref:Histone-lysine N-methyltransferase SET9 n=1 Tax=Cytospora mali TaxID=578113 RepID=A0A194VN75_CYTMA|nr:Histone-lysine N-methyltransferase set9 [Valsa mali]